MVVGEDAKSQQIVDKALRNLVDPSFDLVLLVDMTFSDGLVYTCSILSSQYFASRMSGMGHRNLLRNTVFASSQSSCSLVGAMLICFYPPAPKRSIVA